MWGGRFASAPDALMQEINASIDVDKRLWREDIEGSKAHAAMLSHQGIIPQADAAAIDAGRGMGMRRGQLPNTEWNSDRICSLPLFPDMTEQDVDDAVKAIKEVLGAQ